MIDLIDRSEVLARLCAACSNMGSFACLSCTILKNVKAVPTIEAEPVQHVMTLEQLNSITSYLREKVWRNADVMYMQSDNQGVEEIEPADLVNIISSLHNLLYEVVTGKRYDYAFHWCNKVGAWTEDNIFDEIMKGENNERRQEND